MTTFGKMSRRAQVRREGFTLLELILVMAILVVLAGIGTVAYNRIGTQQKIRAARFETKNIKNLCMNYQLQVGNYPRALNDLVALPSGMTQAEWQGPYFEDGRLPKDPWGNDYQYRAVPAQDRVFVTSNGPDGAKNTADDVPRNEN
jgi:general secretion pathway protein G